VISSYSDYQVQVMRLMDGDDVSASEIPLATMEQVINLAERRIYREVRSRFNEKAFTGVVVTGNLATLPSDFESISTVHFGGRSLRPVTEEWLRDYLECEPTGECSFFASAGNSLQFGPAVADATAVQGRYFYRLDDLTRANFSANTFIAREPDLFIAAALVEAIPFFLQAKNQAQSFTERYERIKMAVNAGSSNVALNASRLTRSPSARLVA
jgi:hypothetical protein